MMVPPSSLEPGTSASATWGRCRCCRWDIAQHVGGARVRSAAPTYPREGGRLPQTVIPVPYLRQSPRT
jgi:hypothetical protein